MTRTRIRWRADEAPVPRWMNGYVDAVNRVIREKQQYDAF